MTTFNPPRRVISPRPHVNLARDQPPTVAPTSPTPARPTVSTNRRFSNIQSKVGSLETISYKPKPSEKKIQSFKQDFSHIKSKVDAKLDPTVKAALEAATADMVASKPTVVTTLQPTVRMARSTSTGSTSSTGPRKALSPPPSASRTATVSSVRTGRPQGSTILSTSTSSSSIASARSPPQSRRSSTSSVTSPTLSPTSPRRVSKHIIPTQKHQYDHVKSKVGSLDNINYTPKSLAGSGRPSSRAGSSTDGSGGALSPMEGRSRSPSATSLSGNALGHSASNSTSSTSSSRRSSFKIPSGPKVDYSKVKSKVGSLDYISHTPQGGNIRVFSEKLSFREQAQSKIAKEINITQFYQNGDQSFDASYQEEPSEVFSEIYSDDGQDEHNMPKNILSVLEEVTESVGGLELAEADPVV